MRARFRSFVHAFRGGRVLLLTQANARIHAVATLGVLVAGFALRISVSDWRWLVASIVAVWAAESFNSALEFLADEVSLEKRERIGKAKDLAAAAVLFVALGAAAMGALVFAPYVAAMGR